jgi:flagellar protein FliL
MAEEPEVAPEPVPLKKSKFKLILMIVVLGVVGGGGFLGFKYWRGVAPRAEPKEVSLTEKIKSMVNLEPFLVNLADEDSARFVKVTFKIGLEEAGLGEEFGSNPVIIAAIRDRILSLLSAKTSEELLSAEGKDKLRKELKEKISAILPKGKIVEVFILDFVVQL